MTNNEGAGNPGTGEPGDWQPMSFDPVPAVSGAADGGSGIAQEWATMGAASKSGTDTALSELAIVKRGFLAVVLYYVGQFLWSWWAEAAATMEDLDGDNGMVRLASLGGLLGPLAAGAVIFVVADERFRPRIWSMLAVLGAIAAAAVLVVWRGEFFGDFVRDTATITGYNLVWALQYALLVVAWLLWRRRWLVTVGVCGLAAGLGAVALGSLQSVTDSAFVVATVSSPVLLGLIVGCCWAAGPLDRWLSPRMVQPEPYDFDDLDEFDDVPDDAR